MATDPEIIQQSYEAKLRHLFSVLHTKYLSAQGNEAQETDANKRFQAGVRLARKVRGIAKTLVTP
jgi:hypothetical protein